MADNYDKLWVQKSANQLAINRARQAIENTGRALPCRVTKVSGSIVTVVFEVNAAPLTLPSITIPKAESPWIRMPTQVGDKGVTMPADAYLGGVSGLGGGVANLTRPGNLSALVFVPISNAASGPIDQNAAQIEGPNGVILQDSHGLSSIVLKPTGITGQSTGPVKMSSTTTMETSGTLNTVAGSFVMLGQAAVGNLSTLPNPGGALFSAYQASGAAAIFSNPVGTNLSTLTSTITGGSIQSGLAGLVTAGTITLAQSNSIIAALTGSGGLSSAVSALTSHTNLLSGLGTLTSNVPSLSSVIGISNGLDTVAGGAYGSATSLLGGMTTGLTSGATVNSINSYANSIVSGLTSGSLTPAGVVSSLTSQTSSLTSYVTNDTNNFLSAQSNITQASGFLSAVSNAQSTNAAAQTLMAQVVPPTTLATLKSIGA